MKTCRLACRKPPNNVGSKNKCKRNTKNIDAKMIKLKMKD